MSPQRGEGEESSAEASRRYREMIESLRSANEQLVITALAVQRQIEEAQQQAARLTGERGRLQAILSSIPDAMVCCDEQANVSFANDVAARAMGLARREDAYRPLAELLSRLEIYTPDGQRRAPGGAFLARSLQGETLSGEVAVRHPATGQLRYHQVCAAPVRNEAGRIIGAVAIARDVTERRWMEQAARDRAALAQGRECLLLVAGRTADGIFVQDRDLRYVWVGSCAGPLPKEKVRGRTDFDLLPAEEARRLTEIKKKVLETGVGVSIEIPLTIAGQQHRFVAFYEAVRDSDGQIEGLAGYVREVTADCLVSAQANRHSE